MAADGPFTLWVDESYPSLFPSGLTDLEGAGPALSTSPGTSESDGSLSDGGINDPSMFLQSVVPTADYMMPQQTAFPDTAAMGYTRDESFFDDGSSVNSTTDISSPLSDNLSLSPSMSSSPERCAASQQQQQQLQQQPQQGQQPQPQPQQTMVPVLMTSQPYPVPVKTEPVPPREPVTEKPAKKRARTAKGSQPAAGNTRKQKAANEGQSEWEKKLLEMSSVELSQYINTLEERGPLSAEMHKKLKALLRQVKNRESAQRSRVNKSYKTEEMEARLEYEERNSSIWQNYAHTLQKLLVQHNIAFPAEPEIPAFVPPVPPELSVAVRGGAKRTMRTAGICLMVVVLSVGLFFNAVNRMDTRAQHHVNATGTPAPVTAPGVVPPVDTPTMAVAKVPPPASGRPLLNRQKPTAHAATPAEPADSSLSSSNVVERNTSSDTHAHAGELVPESSYLSFDTEREDSSLALVVPAAKPVAVDSALVPRKTCPVMHFTTKALFGHTQPRVADRSWTLSNDTSYILVNDATEFVPHSAEAEPLALRTEPVIGLLLPAASLNLSNCEPGDVVELVCGVRDANVVPRSILAHSLY